MGEITTNIEKEDQQMTKDKELMGIVGGFIKSIKEYDKHFNMKFDSEHACVLVGYRDSAFGILFSLFTLNHISSGDLHRKLNELNTAIYKKID